MKSGNILPTKLLVKPIEKKEKKTESGIFIPTTTKDPNISADVVLVGEGTPTLQIPIKVGQRVLFSPHAFQTVRLNDEDFQLVDYRDILFYFSPESL